MLPDIDFRNIRPWKGSKNSGFEELCCQLYSLESPEAGSEFFRKEGAGGDAGVECLWTIPDGQIHGLQSKYFPDELGPSQWGQIDHSVRTALDKYPSLSRYTICLPRDLTDRRKADETSQRDEWNARVKKWTGWAQAKEMAVEFVYWGSSELGERLTRDDARYSGRTLFWFGTRSLTSDWFKRKFEMARANLGRRYTPEANVELPIRAVFDWLCRTPALADALRRVHSQVRREEERLGSALHRLEGDTSFNFDLSPLRDALARLDSLFGGPLPRMSEDLPTVRMEAAATTAAKQLSLLHRYLDEWTPSGKNQRTPSASRPLDDARYFARRLDRELDAALAFIGSRQMAAANSRALLIDGEAGMGKSHLIADIATFRLERDWPTLLLLGQHVSAGNPWDAFLSELDLKSHSVDEFLGALDAAGQAARVRALVLVDAINEGGGQRVWRDHVGGFLASVQRFPHVAVALTCRTIYVRSIFPDDLSIEPLPHVTHHGFEGHESEAAAIYLDRYGIARPSTPLLSPEFSNPLFLRTCCEALNRQGKTSFPRGLRGIKSIFDLYLESLDSVLADRMDVDPKEGIGGKALRRLAEKMAADSRGVLARNEAKRLLDEVYSTTGYRGSLLQHLIAEGALADDLEYPAESVGEPQDTVRFTFERFSDHLIAERLLDSHVDGDVDAAFAPEAPLGALLQDRRNWHLRGVVEALAVQVPERYGRELIALVRKHPFLFDLGDGFLKSVIWREPAACTEETAKLLLRVCGKNRQERFWNTILHIAAEPDHPFNADRLHRNLLQMELPVRDELWSIYLAQNYWEVEDGEPESITRTLVRWAWDSSTSGAEDETARLCGVALTWFFTTSNRLLRDHATKALVSLLAIRPQLAPVLLEMFESVNDPYVAERLYCAVYGSVLQGVPDAALSQIALEIYRRIFEDGSPSPDVLLRDYARGTIEYALSRGCLADEIEMERVRPPYASDEWPLEFPTEEEVEASKYDSIRSSVVSMGDFGRYVMGDHSGWSITPLSEDRVETHRDRVNAFRVRVANDPDPAVAEAFEHLADIATPPAGEDPAMKTLLHLVHRMRGEDAIEDLPGRDRLEEQARAIEEAEGGFLNLLPEHEQAYFTSEIKPFLEWEPMSHLADRPIHFNIMAERRWVWQRAHSLGWSAERFESFERMLPYVGRQKPRVERIGKKYQWIAWHELQARLSDHLYFIRSTGRDSEGSIFEGPWQLSARDIDPSLLMHSDDRDVRVSFPGRVWWRPAVVEHPDQSTTEERVARLWSEDGFPDLKSLLRVRDPDGKEWLVLDGMSIWHDREDDRDPRPRRDTWLRVESFLVARADQQTVLNAWAEQRLTSPHALQNELEYRTFLGEHPWHPICVPELDDWKPAAEPTPFQQMPVRYLIPTVEYRCEPGRDQSIKDSINLQLPSRFLREHLSLHWEGGRGASFHADDGSLLFLDPTTEHDGPPAALVAGKPFLQMLEAMQLTLMWRIGGEKGLYGRGFNSEFYGRQVLSAVYYTEGENIVGREWRIDERPSGS